MDRKMIEEAESYLKSLKRIHSVEEGKASREDVLYLPEEISLLVDEDSNVKTVGLDEKLDKKAKDLLRVIKISDALNMEYTETNILSPSVYVHSLNVKPWHITTQGFLVTNISRKTAEYIQEETRRTKEHYGRHEMDHFWLSCSKPLEEISEEEMVCIFNRRISGWDGSMERPVIELLGAGGHLQNVWDEEQKKFVSRSFADNLKKEFSEEIGLNLEEGNMKCIGGFINSKTQELVIFSCIYIEGEKIPGIQKYALNNFEEDTDGIYLGSLKETLEYYKKSPDYFAGGTRAAQTNFPNNEEIMRKIYEEYSIT